MLKVVSESFLGILTELLRFATGQVRPTVHQNAEHIVHTRDVWISVEMLRHVVRVTTRNLIFGPFGS